MRTVRWSLVNALIELTPTHHFSSKDFEDQGIADWQDWLNRICNQAVMLAIDKLTQPKAP